MFFLLQLAGEPFFNMFSGLLKIMERVQRGETEDVSQMMIPCSLPSNPNVNLVPEFVCLVSSFKYSRMTPKRRLPPMHSRSGSLATFNVWLVRAFDLYSTISLLVCSLARYHA